MSDLDLKPLFEEDANTPPKMWNKQDILHLINQTLEKKINKKINVEERLENLEEYRHKQHKETYRGLLKELKKRFDNVYGEETTDTNQEKENLEFWGGKLIETFKHIEYFGKEVRTRGEDYPNLYFYYGNTGAASDNYEMILLDGVEDYEKMLLDGIVCEDADTKKNIEQFVEEFEEFVDKRVAIYSLPEDTTSLIMVNANGVCTLSLLYGLIVYILQIAILALVFWEERENTLNTIKDTTCDDDNVEEKMKLDLVIGKSLVVLLTIITQSDILEPPISSTILLNTRDSDFQGLFRFSKDTIWEPKRFCRFFIPNLIKFGIGLMTLLASIALIVNEEESFIELLKDYTAVLFVSEIDNYFFSLIKLGYCGQILSRKAENVSDANIEYVKSRKLSIFRLFYMTLVMSLTGVFWLKYDEWKKC